MNKKGHPPTLRARQPANRNALTSGVHSQRYLDEMAKPLIEEMAQVPHIEPADRYAVEEAARLRALIALADDHLLRNGLTNRRGEPQSLFAIRLRASKQYERYLIQLGMTPLSRQTIGSHTTVADVVARLEEAATQAREAERDAS